MTDMALHRAMTMAWPFVRWPWFDDEDRELPRRRWRRFSWPHHATFYLTIGPAGIDGSAEESWSDSIQLRPWNIWPQRNLASQAWWSCCPTRSGLWSSCGTRPRPLPGAFYLHLGGHLVRPAVRPRPGRPRACRDRVSAYLSSLELRRLARAQLLPALCSRFSGRALVRVPWAPRHADSSRFSRSGTNSTATITGAAWCSPPR